MEQSGFGRAVGFVLAWLFAIVMGLCIFAVLIPDHMEPGRAISEQALLKFRIYGIAGGSAGLFAWWLQSFAAHRGFAIRFIYGLVIFLLVFASLGGLLEVGSNYLLNPGPHDFSPSGLYWASLGGFYTFAVFLLAPFKPGLLGVLLAPGVILAFVGPREIP